MSDRDGYQAGVPCWVDVWHPEADAGTAFYAGLFGWEAHEDDGGGEPRYAMCTLRGRQVAGVGAPLPAGARTASWTTYVQVDDVDASAQAARDAGGQVVNGPFDALDGGRMAILEDPAGAVLGVWSPGAHRGAEVVNEPGAWSIGLLNVPDPDAVAAFYKAVFGWDVDPFGPDVGVYRLPGFVGGEPQQPVPRDVVAAVARRADVPPHWLVDFWVADLDAVVARAGELGGRVVAEPYDVPPGRQAVLADPHGAVFSVTQIVMPG